MEKEVILTCLNCDHASPHAREPYGACWCGCDNYLPKKPE